MIKSPNCNNDILDKANKCINCGYILNKNKIKFCSECGNKLNFNDTICNKCGYTINKNIKPKRLTKENKLKIILIIIMIALIVGIIVFFIISLKELRNINEEVIKGNEISDTKSN